MNRGDLIGTGAKSDVIYWEEGKVVKLFKNPEDGYKIDEGNGLNSFNREYDLSTKLPKVLDFVPKAHGVVEHDGRKGIIFDYIQGESLLSHFMKNPFKIKKIGQITAEIQAKLHAIDYKSIGLDAILERGVKFAMEYINDRDLVPPTLCEKLKQYIDQRNLSGKGDVLIHGDFHPGNIILSDDKPYLIDWGASYLAPPGVGVCYTKMFSLVGPLMIDNPVLRSILGYFGKSVGKAHVKAYKKITGLEQDSIDEWMPILAAGLLSWRKKPVTRWAMKIIEKHTRDY